MSDPTVAEALAAFRSAYGLSSDEASRPSWSCKLGPWTLRLPNWQWRRRAILAHDLHHLLTGIPCTLHGECQIAAWELAAGPMPHWAARLFCQPLILLGMLGAPRDIWRAFLSGRRSQSLHNFPQLPALLHRPLGVARAGVAVAHASATHADRARFTILLLQAAAIVLSPVAALLATAVVLLAT